MWNDKMKRKKINRMKTKKSLQREIIRNFNIHKAKVIIFQFEICQFMICRKYKQYNNIVRIKSKVIKVLV